jgi:phosphoserine aminotransferase
MISFYPGPSRVHDEIPLYVKDGFKEGILSVNHRSEDFMTLYKKTDSLLRNRLGIPKDYSIFFTSSATECWEALAQSVVTDKSFHLYNGAFGQKWYEYTKRLRKGAESLLFAPDKKLDPKTIQQKSGLICITQNETSNGTQVSNAILKSIKRNNPDSLVAVDATSSMAGVTLNFKVADIWFASVQKCFGLPAGLGLLICSSRAIQHAEAVGEKDHYNSLTFMKEMQTKWQTSYTPNVLGIYLLMRVMENSQSIRTVNQETLNRYTAWIEFLSERKSISHLIKTRDVQSYTVLPVTASADVIQTIKTAAKREEILLGNGYGEWKSTTFRIANFPAIKRKEITKLMQILGKY